MEVNLLEVKMVIFSEAIFLYNTYIKFSRSTPFLKKENWSDVIQGDECTTNTNKKCRPRSMLTLYTDLEI